MNQFAINELIYEFPIVDDKSQKRKRKTNNTETSSKLIKLEPRESICETNMVLDDQSHDVKVGRVCESEIRCLVEWKTSYWFINTDLKALSPEKDCLTTGHINIILSLLGKQYKHINSLINPDKFNDSKYAFLVSKKNSVVF